MLTALLVALRLVQFTGPDHQGIEVNPDEIVAIREPRENEQGHFHDKVQCLIFTSDGKFFGVIEECHEVHKRLQEVE